MLKCFLSLKLHFVLRLHCALFDYLYERFLVKYQSRGDLKINNIKLEIVPSQNYARRLLALQFLQLFVRTYTVQSTTSGLIYIIALAYQFEFLCALRNSYKCS